MILYFIYSQFFPAYKAGGPVRSLLNLADALNQDLQIRVICSSKDIDGSLLNVPNEEWTYTIGHHVFYTDKGFKGIQQACGEKKTDCIFFINGIYSIQFSFLPAMFLRGRKIISVRGMLHPGGLSQKQTKKKIYLVLWKILRLHKKCEYHATSVEERQFIYDVFGMSTKVWVIPNLPTILPFQGHFTKEPGSLVLCTLALISPMKNHHLVLQALTQTSTKVLYHVYGPVKDPDYWKYCEKLIRSMPPNIKVIYHGEIAPTAITGALSECHVVIQPSKSENFGHSLFEALSCGRPVITSHNTPWSGLKESFAGYNASTDGAEDIKNAIDFFGCMTEKEFKRWATGARDHAMQCVDAASLKTEYLAMFSNN